VDPADVGDVVIGSVLGPSSQRANECRIAMFLAGMPEITPVHTVNRFVVSKVVLFGCAMCVLASNLYGKWLAREQLTQPLLAPGHGSKDLRHAGNALPGYKRSQALLLPSKQGTTRSAWPEV
jgi:hypothetical protein